MRILIFSLCFLIIGCASMNKSRVFTQNKPKGFLQPTNQIVIDSKKLIDENKFGDAIARLANFNPKTKLDESWKGYLLGISYFGDKKLEKGIDPLNACYELVKSNTSAESDHFRLAGMCIKKIGWFHRNKKDYINAFAYHNIRYRYVLEHGSNLDIHDSLISLDVDAYFLKDLHLSEKVLKESIQYGEGVHDDKNRTMALGTTYNNLGGTLYGLKNFVDAEKTIKTSLKFWQQYEDITGVTEFKVGWAFYGIGDVYENWTKHLKESQKNYSDKKKLALKAYRESLKLAWERKMPESVQKYIKERIQAVNGF